MNKSGNYGMSERGIIALAVCALQTLREYDRRVFCHHSHVIMQYADYTHWEKIHHVELRYAFPSACMTWLIQLEALTLAVYCRWHLLNENRIDLQWY